MYVEKEEDQWEDKEKQGKEKKKRKTIYKKGLCSKPIGKL